MTQRNKRQERRAKVDGSAGQVAATGSGEADIYGPPVGSGITGAKRRAIWTAIIRTRARVEWREGDLLIAARICLNTFELEKMRKTLRRLGWLDADGKAAHPLVMISNRLATEIRSDCRLIGLSAAIVGTASDWGNLRKAERDARENKERKAADPRALRLIA